MGEEFPGEAGGLLASFSAGSRVAGYTLEKQVGAGGMAVVFRARDERLGRPVALKLLAPGLAADATFRQRFIRESRAAAAVDDPNIIPVYEAGGAGGVLFLAMRYVAGGDVRSLVTREGPLPSARAAAIVSPMASALDAAHAAGLVHRDVKPANMLLDVRPGRPDHVYLSDFGLSKGALSSAGLTGAGNFLGTVNYVAPEQIQGQGVDGRADQYALACAAFELLVAQAPFQRDDEVAVIWAHLSQPPPSLAARRPGLPAAVDTVFARALAKAPEDRYASCRQFADALRDALGLAAYHTGTADIPAADRPGAGDWETGTGRPAGPSDTPDLAIPAAAGTVSSPHPAPGRASPPVRRRLGRRPGRAALAGIAVVAVAGAAAGVILASFPTHGSAGARGHASASSHGHGSPGPCDRGSASSPGQAPEGYLLACTLTDLRPGARGVYAVTFSPDGKTLAAGDWSGTIYLRDADTGNQTAALTDPNHNGDGVTSLAYSPDGKTLATGDANGSTYLWNVLTRTRTAVLTGPGSLEVDSVAFSPDGRTLAVGDANGSTYLWRVAARARTGILSRPAGVAVDSVAFSRDGTTLATGDTDGNTYLWDVASGAQVAVLHGPANRAGRDGVNSVAFSPDGATLATGNYNGTIYLWNVGTRTRTAVLTDLGAPASGDGVNSVAFKPHSQILATGDYNGTTYLWDVATRTPTAVLTDPGGDANVNSAAFSPDGKTLATGDWNGSTYLWEAR